MLSKFEKYIYPLFIVGVFLSGVICLIIFNTYSSPFLLVTGISLILSILIWGVLKKRRYISQPESNNKESISSWMSGFKVVSTVYWILFASSLLLLQASNDTRPLGYFICISLSAGCIAAIILFTPGFNNSIIFSIFIKVFALGLNVVSSVYLYYGGAGSDYWTHLNINSLLASSGSLPSLISYGKEMYFPLMHISVAESSILCDIATKIATYISITVPLILALVFVYLCVSRLFGTRCGLCATLIASLSSSFLMWGQTPQTTTNGIILILVLLYIVQKILTHNETHDLRYLLLYVIMLVCLLLTHAVSSFIFLIITGAVIFGVLVYTLFVEKGVFNYIRQLLGLFIVSIMAIFLQLYYSNYSESQSFFSTVFSFLLSKVESSDYGMLVNQIPNADIMTSSTFFIAKLIDNIPFGIVLLCTILAAYIWLSPKRKTLATFTIIIIVIILSLFAYALPTLGFDNFIPDRWPVYVNLFLSIGCAYIIACHLPRKKIWLSVGVIILVVFSFGSIISSSVNFDSPLFGERTGTAYQTHADLAAKETIKEYSLNVIISDSRYVATFSMPFYDNINVGISALSLPIDGEYLNNSIIILRSVAFKGNTIEGISSYSILSDQKYYDDILSRNLFIPDSNYVNNTEHNCNKIYMSSGISGYSH